MSFPLIDVLRGLCALSVVIYHVIAHFEWTSFPASGPLLWFRFGWLGVDMFFVISGFVISLSAFNVLHRRGTEGFRRTFLIHRAARIAPLHYITCFFFVLFIQPFMFFDTAEGWPQFLTHFFFIHNLFPMHQGGINGVNWSLGDEAQFYLIVLIFAPLLARTPWMAILLGGVTVSWTWRLLGFWTTSISDALGSFYRFWAVTQLPGMLDEFAAGILLARFIQSPLGQRTIKHASFRLWLFPILSLSLTWVTLTILFRNGNFWDSITMVVLFRTLIAVTCGCILLTVCCFHSPALMKAVWPLRYLGTISYGIYLWHLIIIKALHSLPWLDAGRALPAVLILTVGMASMSWHILELPLMQRLKAWSPTLGGQQEGKDAQLLK